jgi:hypothetical protein
MHGLPVEIVRLTCSDFPGWAECRFVDAGGVVRTFIEKTPIVREDYLYADSSFPQYGVIACKVVEYRGDVVLVDTTEPYAIEAVDGNSRFEVPATLLVHF